MEGRAIANKENIAFITLPRSHVTSKKLAKKCENDAKGGGGGRSCPHKTSIPKSWHPFESARRSQACSVFKLGLLKILGFILRTTEQKCGFFPQK
jgi:hypothetical protein